jgi:RNA polymerase sigma-70 factor (ECF subfamily)
MKLVECLRLARPDLDASGAELEDHLAATWEKARRQDVPFPAEAFVAHLARHLPAGDVALGIASLRTEDLYLAGACATGVRAALDVFERELAAEVTRAVKRSGSAATRADDVAQALREKLFVAKDGEPAKIAEYSGQGPLRVWLRVVSTRLVQNLSMRGPKETPLDGALLADIPASTGDPMLDALRETYRAEFRAAFSAAVASLDVRDRVLLRQRFSSKQTQEELAAEYGVHVNTVARWLGKARQTVEERTREELGRRLRLGEGEFTSVLRLVASQLDLTLGKSIEG